MQYPALGKMEAHFADIIWNAAPISSGALVTLCAEELGWKKSTTYTMLKRLCNKGLFQNENGVVTALVSRQAFEAQQSEAFVDKTFAGSLPRFLAAFSTRKKLTAAQIEELERLIAAHRQEDSDE